MHKAVSYQKFESASQSWDELFAQAAEFASSLGQERLISISHSDSHYLGVVTVWYWSE